MCLFWLLNETPLFLAGFSHSLGTRKYFEKNFVLSKKVVSLIHQNKQIMKTVKTNIHNVQPGDIISFTNSMNCKQEIRVTRVEEKSCYNNRGGRESWGTINRYLETPGSRLIKWEGNISTRVKELVKEYRKDPNCRAELWISGEDVTEEEKKAFISLATTK